MPQISFSASLSAAANAATRPRTAGANPEPVADLRFKVELEDAKTVGHFGECSGLSVEWEVMPYQEGGENRFEHKLKGRMKYPNLVLKRGVTDEDALLNWLFEKKDVDKRGSVVVSLMSPDNKVVRRWAFAGAFPVKWTGPTMNAGSNNIATETLEIAHQGLVRS